MSAKTSKTAAAALLIVAVLLLILDAYAWATGAPGVARVMLAVAAVSCAVTATRLGTESD